MIDFKEAQAIVLRHRVAPTSVRAPLKDSLQRVLARDVRAGRAAPAFDRSLFDGYAVRAADVKRPGVTLRLLEEVFAGRSPRKTVSRGACSWVATGAVMPKGADAVVKKEDARPLPGGGVLVRTAVGKGANLTRAGSYFEKGACLLRKGVSLDAACIGLLASQGVGTVRVLRPPRVAVLSTGDEIVEAGRRARPAQVRNASAPMLLAALQRLGIEGRYLGLAPDRPQTLKRKLAQGLRADVFIVTGAVSVGRKDHVPALLRRLGVRVLFHKVRIRPGKPILFGSRGRRIVFGLPGNAVSSLVTFHLFVRPVLERLLGRSSGTVFEKGVLAKPAGNDSGRLSFLPGRLQRRAGEHIITPLRFCDSSDLRAAAAADVFYVLRETQTRAGKGTAVPFFQRPS